MKKITPGDILHFFRQLSTLVAAGISLMKSLVILSQASDKSCFKSMIHGLSLDLESGQEFSLSLRRYPQFFDLFTCQLVRIGEQTGTLDRALHRISLYQEKSLALRKQVQQALLYPALVLFTALITLVILLFFVVPQFASLFERFPAKIPLPTLLLFRLAHDLRLLSPWLGLMGLLAAFAVFHWRGALRWRARCRHLVFQVRPLRNLAIQIAMTHFSRSLGVILAAGLPLTEALLMVAQLSPFDEIRRSVLKAHAGVNSGKSLASTLALLPLFPSLLTQMIRIGEESGTLDLMLSKFAELQEIELEQGLASFRLLLEPLIIGILGVLIGGIVIAMYLPIFRLGTAIS